MNEKSSVKEDGNSRKEPEAFRVIDKRHFLDLDQVETGPPAEEKPRFPSFVEEMMAKMELTERKFEEKKSQMHEEIARTKTRLENDFQRRVDAERQRFILPFLEVLDNLERARAAAGAEGNETHLLQGVQLIVNQFRTKLQMGGVEAIPVLDQPFDPNIGQAVAMIPVTDPALDGMVVEELQRGYRMGEQLLRPAQVRVGQIATSQVSS
jgi:molecular chaperone GrpE